MRASPLVRGAAQLIDAEIAFCGFLQRDVGHLVADKSPPIVADLDHPNIVVGTRIGARSAPDTGQIVDHHHAVLGLAVDGAGRAADHAHRVDAVHARIGDHKPAVTLAVADEARIAVVRRGARAHALIAAHTAIVVDDHGRRPVDETVLDQELEQVGVDVLAVAAPPCRAALAGRRDRWR